MNAWSLVILAGLLARDAVYFLGDIRNLRSLDRPVPASVNGVQTPETRARAQAYTRDMTRQRLAERAIFLTTLIIFWFAGGFRFLDHLARGPGLGPIPTGLLFLGLIALAELLLGLPFRIHRTFGIEERFGFNRTTAGTFLADLLKEVALGMVLGGLVAGGLLALLVHSGTGAWLYAWLGAAAFVVIMNVMVPIWILPWFNRFRPLEDGALREAVVGYVRSVGFPVSGVFVIDGSRRSTHGNAFFTGLGRSKRIALFDTLIGKHPIRELVGIVAHEAGHYKNGHIWKATAVGVLQIGVALLLLSVLIDRPGLHRAFGVEQPSIHTGLVFFGLLYAPVGVGLSVLAHTLSRRHEYEADAYAVRTTGDPDALAAALRKLADTNLTNLTPDPLHVFINHGHPPLARRLEAIARLRG